LIGGLPYLFPSRLELWQALDRWLDSLLDEVRFQRVHIVAIVEIPIAEQTPFSVCSPRSSSLPLHLASERSRIRASASRRKSANPTRSAVTLLKMAIFFELVASDLLPLEITRDVRHDKRTLVDWPSIWMGMYARSKVSEAAGEALWGADRGSPRTAGRPRTGLSQQAEARLPGSDVVSEDVLPFEVNLDQLPKRLTRGSDTFDLAYIPIQMDGQSTSVLLVVTDVTVISSGRRSLATSSKIIAIFKSVTADRVGFADFLLEADRPDARPSEAKWRGSRARARLHTLKGVCSAMGISTMATMCHALETNLRRGGSRANDSSACHNSRRDGKRYGSPPINSACAIRRAGSRYRSETSWRS